MSMPVHDRPAIRRIAGDNIGCLQQGVELIGGFEAAPSTLVRCRKNSR
jgi:hypothetical protein